jgi:hypothetical protein
MRSLKNLFQALAFLALAALVLGAFAFCVAELLIGGVN